LACPWQYTVTMLNDQEQERFMRLWTESQQAVVNYIHATVRDPAAAKDLVQETALVLFRRFSEYDGQRPFLAWALGVAQFQVRGFHRDAARSLVCFDTELFDRFTELWAETAAAASERSSALEVCLERLPARPRQMLRLRYFEELNSEEIARRLGSKSAAVRVTLQRIREQLRACVEQQLRMERRAT
jgi:RNA polymerase sigma-70 factor (ECF subfamily)